MHSFKRQVGHQGLQTWGHNRLQHLHPTPSSKWRHNPRCPRLHSFSYGDASCGRGHGVLGRVLRRPLRLQSEPSLRQLGAAGPAERHGQLRSDLLLQAEEGQIGNPFGQFLFLIVFTLSLLTLRKLAKQTCMRVSTYVTLDREESQ